MAEFHGKGTRGRIAASARQRHTRLNNTSTAEQLEANA